MARVPGPGYMIKSITQIQIPDFTLQAVYPSSKIPDCDVPSSPPMSHSPLPIPYGLHLAATLDINNVPSPRFHSRTCTMASLWMAERRPDEKGTYRATLTSVVSKTFVYMSQCKQRNRVLLFRKPVYCFATRVKQETRTVDVLFTAHCASVQFLTGLRTYSPS